MHAINVLSTQLAPALGFIADMCIVHGQMLTIALNCRGSQRHASQGRPQLQQLRVCDCAESAAVCNCHYRQLRNRTGVQQRQQEHRHGQGRRSYKIWYSGTFKGKLK